LAAGALLGGLWWKGQPPAPADHSQREALCRRDPADASACAALGTAKLMSGELDAARELAARALKVSPDDLHARLLDAAIEQASGHPAAAKEKYEALEKIHPESGLPAANLSMLALEAHDLDGASAAAERAVQKDPRLGMAHAMRARILGVKGDRAGAERELELAVALDPGATETRLELADLYASESRGAARLKLLRETVMFSPDDPAAHLGYGQALEQSGDLNDAGNELRLAETLAPKDARIGLALARVRLEQGKPDFAVPRLKEILEAHPDSVEARLLFAAGLHAQGSDPEALEELDAILSRKDLRPEERSRALRTRARVQAGRGDSTAALADYGAILVADSSNGIARVERAHLLLDLGRYDEAERDLRAVNTKGYPTAQSMLDQARFFAHAGEDAAAVNTLRALLDAHRFDADQVRAQPELRRLEGNPDYRLLFEDAKQ
ncbi:MAG TPA: tetratricopeptide repeat protein, partial [bacterium]|nr:tetratricopeptide repeat protein [bacterium]